MTLLAHVLAPRPSHTAILIESVMGTENSPSSRHKIEKKNDLYQVKRRKIKLPEVSEKYQTIPEKGME